MAWHGMAWHDDMYLYLCLQLLIHALNYVIYTITPEAVAVGTISRCSYECYQHN